MYIKSCYIENFGKFHEFSIEFERGLNVIKENNGWGKTTLMAFIKAMLYGMTYRPNAKEFYDRRRYEPWSGGKFGGYMIFALGDKEYKVTRFFGKKDMQDEFELIDINTGKITKDYSEKLGEELFGIDMDSFERSVFIAGNKKASITDGINAKLNNLIENADDIGNFDKAYDNLDKAIKNLHKRGGGGEIQKKAEQVKMLEEKCRDCDSKAGLIVLQKTNIDEYNLKKQEYEKKIKAIDDKIGKAELYNKSEQYKILKKRRTEAEIELGRLKQFFDKHLPSEEELLEYYSLCAEADSINHSIETLGEVKECADNEESRIDECVADYKEAVKLNNLLKDEAVKYEALEKEYKILEKEAELTEERKGIGIKGIFFVLSLLAAVVVTVLQPEGFGLIGGVVLKTVVVVAYLIAVFFAILIIRSLTADKELVARHKNVTDSKAECAAELENIKKSAEELKKRGREYTAKYTGFISERLTNPSGDFIEDLSIIRENYSKYCRLMDYKGEFVARKIRIKTFLGYYTYSAVDDNATYYDKLQIIRDNFRDYVSAKEYYAKVCDGLDAFEAANDIGKILSVAGEEAEYIDIAALQRERGELQSEAAKLLALINRAEKTIDDISYEVDRRQEYESRIEGLKEEIAGLEDRYNILTLTKNTLEAAKERLATRYMEDMKNAFKKYLDIFEVSDNIKLGLELDTCIEKNGKDWDDRYFSQGHADMADICVRLALLDAMYKEEKPVLVLDDPFVNLDDNKLAKGLKAIEKIAEDRQIIYSVCSSIRSV